MRPVVEQAVEGSTAGTVVDVGGGTAQVRALWPSAWRYIAVDTDARMEDIRPDGMERVTGSAAQVPLPDGLADHVFFVRTSRTISTTGPGRGADRDPAHAAPGRDVHLRRRGLGPG